MLDNLRFRARLRCRRSLTSLHITGIVGFHHTQAKSSSSLEADAQTHQGFIDERAPLNATVADSSPNANVDEDEDERDDEMSEPTHLTRTEKRKVIQTDEISKRVTGTVNFS